MTEFEKIIVSRNSIPSLIITVVLMIAIPVIFFIYWRRKHKEQTKLSWLIAGAIGFIVSARVLELGVHYFCILADNPISRFINGNTAAFVLYEIGLMLPGEIKNDYKFDAKTGDLFNVEKEPWEADDDNEYAALMKKSAELAAMYAAQEETAPGEVTEERDDGCERHRAAVFHVPSHWADRHRILRRRQCKEDVPAIGHPSAYADGYIPCAVSEKRGSSVVC